MNSKAAVAIFGLSLLGMPLFGDESPKTPDASATTQRVSFAPGGSVSVSDSCGYLNVEGWDRAEAEVTVTGPKPTGVRIMAERRSDTELAISTIFPPRNRLTHPLNASTDMQAQCEIHIPSDSKLVIHHRSGNVLVSNMNGDIQATSRTGDIILMLPDAGKYAIDAKSNFGSVSSDFAGATNSEHMVGHQFASPNVSPSRRIFVRIEFGSITIKDIPLHSRQSVLTR